MTVKNVAGERVQTITFTIPANGGTYVGETLNEAGNFIALPVTVSSRNTATLYLTVTSENGKNSHIYMITVNFKSDDSSVDFIRYTQDLNRLGILQIKSDGTSQDQVLQFQGTETVLTDVWSAEERYGDMAKITPNAAMTDVERNYYTTPLGGAIPHIVYKGYLSEENLNGSLSVSLQAKDSTATAYLYRWGESTPRSRQSSSITLENPSAALAALRDVRNDPDNYDKVAARFYGYVESALGERTYVVLELYNARKGEALIGRLDTETEGDFDLKPVDSEVFKDDTYAIWAYENNTIPTDYPANAKVENPFDTANPNSGWSAKLDDNGHILPESFTATISGDAAGAKVVVRAEHDGSWISISTEPTHFNDYTQGTRMWQGMFAMASTRQTLYIHVMDDDKGSIESNRNSFDPVTREPLYGRRYTLYLNPANTDRSLDTVTLMGDEDDLNRRGDPIKVQRNQTEVNVEVAPTSQTVDVRLITTQPTAMVEVFRMSDSTGTFNRHDRSTILNIYDKYDDDIDRIDKTSPTADNTAVIHEGYLTLPIPVGQDSARYMVVVSNVLGDSKPAIYYVNVVRRLTGLEVERLTVNERGAVLMRSDNENTTFNLELDVDDQGRLIVREGQGDWDTVMTSSNLYQGNSVNSDLAGNVLTDSVRDGIVATMGADGLIRLSHVDETGRSTQVILRNVEVYRADMTVDETTADIYAEIRDQQEFVDVHTSLSSFHMGLDSSEKDVKYGAADGLVHLPVDMKNDDTIFYPILLGSRDTYAMGSGDDAWQLPAQVRLVLLKLTKRENAADLDLEIQISRFNGKTDPIIATAPASNDITMGTWDGHSEMIYEREATLTQGMTLIDIMGKAAVETSIVSIYDVHRVKINEDAGIGYSTLSGVDFSGVSQEYYFKVEMPGTNRYRIYHLTLKRGSQNTQLRLANAVDNILMGGSTGVDMYGSPTGGNPNKWVIDLAAGTTETKLYLEAVDELAEVQVFDPEQGIYVTKKNSQYNNYLSDPLYPARADAIERRVRVVAQSGATADYIIVLQNTEVNVDLTRVEVDNNSVARGSNGVYTHNVISITPDEEYQIVKVYLQATGYNATVEIADQGSNSFLAYDYIYGTGDGMRTIRLDDNGKPVPTLTSVPVVSGSSNVLTLQILMPKNAPNMFFNVTVRAMTSDGDAMVSKLYTLELIHRVTDVSDLMAFITEREIEMRLVRQSNGKDVFHYVEMLADKSQITTDGDEYFYYESKGQNGELAGRLYVLDPQDIDYQNRIDNCNIYHEIIFSADTAQVQISTTFSNIQAKKNQMGLSSNMPIGISIADKVGTLPEEEGTKFVNSQVVLTGSTTTVPITVRGVGSSSETFNAIVRKRAVDQYLNYIRVDGKEVDLIYDAEQQMLVGTAIVFNPQRSATVEISSTISTALIDVIRSKYAKYDSNIPPVMLTEPNGTPVWVTGDGKSGIGDLQIPVLSLNDADEANTFLIDVQIGDITMTYKLIIHLVNVAIQLDNLWAYEGDTVDAKNLVPFDNSYTPVIHDYTVKVMPNTSTLGIVTVQANGWDSYEKFMDGMRDYYENAVTGYYNTHPEELVGTGMTLAEAVEKETKRRLDELEVNIYIDDSKLFADTTYTAPVQSGIDHGSYGDGFNYYTVDMRNVDINAIDIRAIPVVIEVEFEDNGKTYTYKEEYNINYHKLSDDNTLAKGDSDFGVLGHEPVNPGETKKDPVTEHDRPYKQYSISFVLDEVEIYAHANHDHEGNTTMIYLDQYVTNQDGSRSTVSVAVGRNGYVSQRVHLNAGLNEFVIRVVSESGCIPRITTLISSGLPPIWTLSGQRSPMRTRSNPILMRLSCP